MSPTSLGFRKASTSDEVAGSLHLEVAPRGPVTRPVTADGRGVLRVMQPLYLDDSGQVTYMVMNPGGAYFGEKYRYKVAVQPHANLLLTTQGATRIYRTPAEPAVHEAWFAIGAQARLEYLPDQTIAYKNADYHQSSHITAAPDAQGFFAEILTPGWDPEGTMFTYSDVWLRTDVRTADSKKLVFVDNIRMQPRALGHDIDGIGYLEGASHMGSVLILGSHTVGAYADHVHELVIGGGLTQAGVTTGSRHGVSWLMVRALANSTDSLHRTFLAVNEFDRSVTTGQNRLDLRRY